MNHNKQKHIDIAFHFVRELVENKTALPQGPDPGAGSVLRQAFPRSSAWPVARKSHKKHISICCCQRIVNLATVCQNLTIKIVLRNGRLQQSLYRSHTKLVLQISQSRQLGPTTGRHDKRRLRSKGSPVEKKFLRQRQIKKTATIKIYSNTRAVKGTSSL